MRVTKASVIRACAVCERTLLQGEYALRFSPDGVEFVDVCPLCQEDVARALAARPQEAPLLGPAPGVRARIRARAARR